MSEKVVHSGGVVNPDPIKHKFGRTSRLRSRTTSTVTQVGDYFYRPSNIKATTRIYGSGRETTSDSVGNWKLTARNNYDAGGHFDSRKVSIESLPVTQGTIYRQFGDGIPVTESYTGTLYPAAEIRTLAQSIADPKKVLMPTRFTGDIGVSLTYLRGMGATAINRTIPTAPNVSVAQTIGELKEGLPNLTLRALKRGDVGGEYLNTQFGILPLVSDVSAYRETARDAEKILAQWKRDSGRRIRRRYTFAQDDPEIYTEKWNSSLYGTHGGIAYAASSGVVSYTRTTSRKTWFSGAYRYYVPWTANDLLRKLQETNRLYDLVPSASTAWELLPFSWLLDWETNVGDVISNWSRLGQDGLVLTYGYIMCHSRVTHDYVWKGNIYHGTVGTPAEISARVVVDTKQRLGASPYGLGWTIEELSPRQIAILAALGITTALR